MPKTVTLAGRKYIVYKKKVVRVSKSGRSTQEVGGRLAYRVRRKSMGLSGG